MMAEFESEIQPNNGSWSKEIGGTNNYPLSTSPRKLQEMALLDGNTEVASVSGISMKQYEEQLGGLKKENFQLKLRVYFLEEKLGGGSPPAIQGMLEHNVRLQVELEELKRQLKDKQQLLAAAAEAIDVLEHQDSLSINSEEGSINGTTALRGHTRLLEPGDDCNDNAVSTSAQYSEDAVDGFNRTQGQEELVSLKCEHNKALQTIKSCMKRIQQQEKQIKRLLSDKEIMSSQVSDSQVEKYEEILRCKEEHILDLEKKLKEVQNTSNANGDAESSSGNLQELLTRRLQGLAYFLDKLLSHKCVLGADKQKIAESLLEQSLALPVGLKLDESMAPEDFTMDESTMDISHSFRIEDLTMMFGHHGLCDENGRFSRKLSRNVSVGPQRSDIISESECWSEPDRKVSLARIGLGEVVTNAKLSSSDENRQKTRRSRGSFALRSDDSKVHNGTTYEELDRLQRQVQLSEEIETKLSTELRAAEEQIQNLTTERDDLVEALESQRASATEANETAAQAKQALQLAQARCSEVEAQLACAVQKSERLRTERQELESTFAETERSLRRAADEAAVQASQAALDRVRAQHERLRAERELEETRVKLADALDVKAVAALVKCTSDDDRPTSPDQGIDSDRLSSLETTDAVAISPRSLYEENVTLKQKLARTKTTLADTLAQLNAANKKKMSVQRAICREIHKTHGVLRKARDQFESQT